MEGEIIGQKIDHCLIDFFVIVSKGKSACTTEEIEVFIALYIDKVGAFCLFDCDGELAGIGACVGFGLILPIKIELVGRFVHYPYSFYTMVFFLSKCTI